MNKIAVPDGVAGSEADPLGNRAVLLLRLRKLLLGAESLVALFVFVPKVSISALTLRLCINVVHRYRVYPFEEACYVPAS